MVPFSLLRFGKSQANVYDKVSPRMLKNLVRYFNFTKLYMLVQIGKVCSSTSICDLLIQSLDELDYSFSDMYSIHYLWCRSNECFLCGVIDSALVSRARGLGLDSQADRNCQRNSLIQLPATESCARIRMYDHVYTGGHCNSVDLRCAIPGREFVKDIGKR